MEQGFTTSSDVIYGDLSALIDSHVAAKIHSIQTLFNLLGNVVVKLPPFLQTHKGSSGLVLSRRSSCYCSASALSFTPVTATTQCPQAQKQKKTKKKGRYRQQILTSSLFHLSSAERAGNCCSFCAATRLPLGRTTSTTSPSLLSRATRGNETNLLTASSTAEQECGGKEKETSGLVTPS